MWPFRRTEKREASGYTDLILQALVAEADGKVLSATATAALEVAAGLIARSLSAARVEPEPWGDVVTPDVLDTAVRACVRNGESVFAIDVRGGRVMLDHVGYWTLFGGVDPDAWSYQATRYGPSETRTGFLGANSVVHLMWSCDSQRPWQGVSPLSRAKDSGRLAGHLERALGHEVSSIVGTILSAPEAPQDGGYDAQTALLEGLSGGVAILESAQANRSREEPGPREDWNPRRIGAQPPDSLVSLRSAIFDSVLACCGIPPSLADARADGTARRESYRQALHTTFQPLARRIETELRRKLDPSIRLDLRDLGAADVQGRARALGTLVTAGATLGTAAAATGLEGLELAETDDGTATE